MIDRSWPRLGARSRRFVLIVHVASAGTWLGMDVVLGVLVGTALAAPAATAAALAGAIGTFVGWPIVAVALLTLLSGAVLGLGSKYGLLRHWWVTTKLVITIVLIVLVLALLVPSVVDLVAATDGAPTGFEFDRQLIFPPIVSTTALLIAITVSIVKPWGRRQQMKAGPR